MKTFKPNIEQYQVLTPNGFSDFSGISLMGKEPLLRLEFEEDRWVECTFDHKFYTSLTDQIEARHLNVNDTVYSSIGNLRLLKKIDLERSEPVFDLIEVANQHRFYANDMLVSNCEFLVFDETLINSITLLELKGQDPIMKMGQARWYKKIDPSCTYIFSLDPSLGTGGDYAAIQVIEVPSLIQVGEWHHNQTPIQAQARILRDMVKYVDDICNQASVTSSIYYSVENNSVGDSALMAINELGEDTFPGLFLSEPIKKGHVRRFRKGFNTTHAAKIAACSKLKQLVETKQMAVNSKTLISEIKSYIAKGVSFGGKSGHHDDLVASLLLGIRMIMLLQDWDPAIYDKMRDHTGLEEHDLPLPIYISTY